jgi:hypothetical protein
MVGLANVDNTSDANKPVSTATQTALDLKATLASPSFTGTPTIGTNPIAVKPWVSGRFSGVSSGNPNITGTASNVGTGSGVQSFTVTRQQTGTYNITWTTAHPSGSSYTILVAVRGAFTCSYGIPSFYKLPDLYI